MAASSGLRIVVAGMGARASLGASAAAVGAAYRAGIVRHAAHPSLLGRRQAPIVVARDPGLPPEAPLERRLVEMVTDAAVQAVASLPAAGTPRSLDLVVAVPGPRAGVGERVPARVASALRERFAALDDGGPVRIGVLEMAPGSRSAGLAALETSLARLDAGLCEACLWCGVDSYLAPVTLDALDRAGALHGEGARWGFIPGEAAGACLLVAGELADRAGVTPIGLVRAASTALDQRPAGEEDIALGRALTAATRAVLAALPAGDRVHLIYADLNGDRGRVDDAGLTLARISDRVAELPCLTTPADRLGEVGAASAPLFAVLAGTAAQRGRAPGPNVLLWTTDDLGSAEGPRAGAALFSFLVRAREA